MVGEKRDPLRGPQSCGVFLPDLTTAKALLPPVAGVPMGCEGRQRVADSCMG
jgi:hypothetical protein